MGNYTPQHYITSKILKAQNAVRDKQLNEEFTNLKRQIIIDSILSSKSNLEYYDKFIERVKDEMYFNISHVDDLGLFHEILIFLSKKGIGKSYHMIQQCNEVVDAGYDVVIIRVLDADVFSGLADQLISYDAHFTMDSKGRLWHKWQKVIDPETGKEKPRQCGIAMSLSTCLKWKGGGYEKVRLMIFDEASDKRKGITMKDYENFIVSCANSIEREKNQEETLVRWIVYGNTDFESSHPLFEAFQIDPDENLVYITRQPEGAKRPTRILYINSRGLYKAGASNSVFIGSIGNVQRAMSAFLNEASNLTNKVIALDLTVLAEPHICIVFTHQKERWHIRIASYEYFVPDIGTQTWYFAAVGLYNPAYCHGYHTITSENVTWSLYDHLMDFKQDLTDEWTEVQEIIDSSNTFFIGWESAEVLHDQLKRHVDETIVYW